MTHELIMLKTADSGVEYDSRPELSFANQGLCFIVSSNPERLLQNSLAFHPSFLCDKERIIITIILNGKEGKYSFSFYFLLSTFQLWMKEQLSKGIIRQKNFNARIKQWKINIKGGRTMDNDISKPWGKKIFSGLPGSQGKEEICCVTWLSLSNMERTTGSLGKIYFCCYSYLW